MKQLLILCLILFISGCGDSNTSIDPPACETDQQEHQKCDLLNSNLNGEQHRSCQNGLWGAWSDCVDPDLCTDGATRMVNCGEHEAGTREELCVDGQWDQSATCTLPGECSDHATEEQSCGLNGNGTQSRSCNDQKWGNWSECFDPDLCKNETTQKLPCGFNGNGLQEQVCSDGEWLDHNSCIDSDLCKNETSQNISCGLNNNGIQVQNCYEGQWVNSGDCIDDAVCENGITRNIGCGLNGNGDQAQNCTAGQWINDGTCVDPDLCKNNTTQTISCGLNGNGDQAQNCTDGQWVNDGTCVDPDLCENSTTQTISCGLNDNGDQSQNCTDGQWVNDGTCVDPDLCENGTTNYTENSCNESGYQYQLCESGHWSVELYCSTWEQSWAEGDTSVNDIITDNQGNVYITGSTTLLLGENVDQNAGLNDIYLTKYTPQGDLLWIRQWGTSENDIGSDLVVDHENNVYIGGYTSGDLYATNSGSSDAVLIKCSPSGDILWHQQWGTDDTDSLKKMLFDGENHLHILGQKGKYSDSEITLKTISTDGVELKTTHYIYSSNNTLNTDAYDFVIDRTDHLHILGKMAASSPYTGYYSDPIIVKMDSNHTILSENRVKDELLDGIWYIDISRDQKLYLTGYDDKFSGNYSDGSVLVMDLDHTKLFSMRNYVPTSSERFFIGTRFNNNNTPYFLRYLYNSSVVLIRGDNFSTEERTFSEIKIWDNDTAPKFTISNNNQIYIAGVNDGVPFLVRWEE